MINFYGLLFSVMLWGAEFWFLSNTGALVVIVDIIKVKLLTKRFQELDLYWFFSMKNVCFSLFSYYYRKFVIIWNSSYSFGK